MNTNHQTDHGTAPSVSATGAVASGRQLKAHGVTPAVIAERCRPGGPWRQVLPGVYLLRQGPLSSEERVEAALLYAGRDPGAHGPVGGGREAVVTGPAALALHRFAAVPPLRGMPVIDVLVPFQRRLRDAGDVAVHRVRALPRPQDVGGMPCAPVPRALADALRRLDDAETVRRLLVEAVRAGHCDPAAVLAELSAAGVLERPQVAAAVPALIAAGRTMAEQRLYAMVRCHHLPDPVWNVELRLPGGPPLGGVDAYWPEHAVAVAVDTRTEALDDAAVEARYTRQRERLEALGITLIRLTPAELRGSLDQRATVVRTALVASAERTPAAYVVVTPR
ncbi:hypothetical protein OG552_11950 [Streptomyces sp. NBC_01476]|uniref:hypothetical protein n=1 Tax=Streptomyces sp. NBC_01476 TaxID=2903881 RepID=UPI002E30E69D|nr:hypothetical protein [Streptomyces sp. NBC_01476]